MSPTETIIGSGNTFRESMTIHRGTAHGDGKTVVGSNGLYMVGSHIAHDCQVGDKIILGNCTALAGHVHVESGALITALVGVNQFVTVGRNCYVTAMTPVWRDAPPFTKIAGKDCDVRGINEVGMRRAGYSPEAIEQVSSVVRALYSRRHRRPISAVLAEQSARDLVDDARYLVDFVSKSCQSPTGRYLELFRH